MSLPSDVSRRDALTALAVVPAAVALVGSLAHATTPTPTTPPPPAPGGPPSLASKHTPLPLPFKPGGLTGISEKLIVSHHDNNYMSAVKNLNRVETELAAITTDTPPFIVAALREKELTFRNSKALHEAYFGNLGGDGKRSSGLDKALGDAYGSAAAWELQFRQTALGLGGGSGWVVLGLELETGALRVTASGGHPQAQTLAVPVLVLDMYEHAYQMDYGAAHAKYVDAFFANVAWDAVEHRLERARALAASFGP